MQFPSLDYGCVRYNLKMIDDNWFCLFQPRNRLLSNDERCYESILNQSGNPWAWSRDRVSRFPMFSNRFSTNTIWLWAKCRSERWVGLFRSYSISLSWYMPEKGIVPFVVMRSGCIPCQVTLNLAPRQTLGASEKCKACCLQSYQLAGFCIKFTDNSQGNSEFEVFIFNFASQGSVIFIEFT